MNMLLRPLAVVFILTAMASCNSNIETDGTSDSPQEPSMEDSETAQPSASGDDAFVGLKLAEAEELAEQRSLGHRVVVRDGQPLPATLDFREDRVNFEVANEVVIRVTRG